MGLLRDPAGVPGESACVWRPPAELAEGKEARSPLAIHPNNTPGFLTKPVHLYTPLCVSRGANTEMALLNSTKDVK